MTLPAPTYDLMLLLDPQAEESVRAKIVADAAKAIQSQGELVSQAEWGERPLAYPIDRRASAEYHLLQFHVGETALLDGLDRALQIADAVLRHRIIKLKPGTPDPPEVSPARRTEAGDAEAAPAAPAAPAAEVEPAAEAAPAAPAATAPEAEPAAEAEPPVEEAPAEPAAEAQPEDDQAADTEPAPAGDENA